MKELINEIKNLEQLIVLQNAQLMHIQTMLTNNWGNVIDTDIAIKCNQMNKDTSLKIMKKKSDIDRILFSKMGLKYETTK